MNYYFTFGSDGWLEGCYVKIEAENSSEAREKMWEEYGEKWAFQYTEDKFLPQIGQYGLKEVPLGTKA